MYNIAAIRSPREGSGVLAAYFFLVNLKPVAIGFRHVEPVCRIQRDRYRAPEIGFGLGGDVVGGVEMRRQVRY